MPNSRGIAAWVFCLFVLPGLVSAQGTPMDSRATLKDGRKVRLHRRYALRKGTPFEQTLITVQDADEDQSVVIGERNVSKGFMHDPSFCLPFFKSYGVSHSLELADFQVELLETVNALFDSQLATLVETTLRTGDLKSLSPQTIKELRASISVLEADVESKALSTLLPHQLSLRNASRALTELKANGIEGLKSQSIAEAVKLTAEQQAAIKLEMEKLQQGIRDLIQQRKKDVAEMMRLEEKKIEAILTKEQRGTFETWKEKRK